MTGNTEDRRNVLVTRQRLADHLEEEIFDGRLAAGRQLPPERRLAERYGVSRPVVREALRGLAERGLVEVVPGRGAFVREPRTADVARPLDLLFRRQRATPRHMVEARTMLECEAASLAAGRASPEDLASIKRALIRFDGGAGLLDRVGYDLAFHAAVARAARNPVVETMFASVANLVAELMLRSLGDPTVSREGLPYHREIFEAIRDGDAARARSSMTEHLLVAERTYGEDYDRPLETLSRRRLGRALDADELLGKLPPMADAPGEELT